MEKPHALLLNIGSLDDLAALLRVSLQQLTYALWGIDPSKRYYRFTVQKASGGTRTICAPHPFLKTLQRRLYDELLSVYKPRPSVHGFVRDRSIVTNASCHRNRRFVLNVDLEDFFPSINFGRVRGLFMKGPFDLPARVATAIAQLCTCEGVLPQGAPTSPIISNMICRGMDRELQRLCARLRCTYTRYADDLSFSTSLKEFPRALAYQDENGHLQVGAELKRIIAKNGFRPNMAKVRLLSRDSRQEVTGLVVNKKVNVRRSYVRRIRAMLHAWEKYGYNGAEREYRSKYDKKHDLPGRDEVSFRRVVLGSIEYVGMVKGRNDPVFVGLFRKLATLDPSSIQRAIRLGVIQTNIDVKCEGKTDPIHLRAALRWFQERGKFVKLFPAFIPGEGSRKLLNELQVIAQSNARERPVVYLFDRDEPSILQKVVDPDSNYRRWNTGVYSMTLPVPSHRDERSSFGIELLYKDQDLFRTDSNGRRLFGAWEFNTKSLKLSADPTINTKNRSVIEDWGKDHNKLKILDSDVYDANNRNIALPKADFAALIERREGEFANVDFSPFETVFEILLKICAEHYAASSVESKPV